MGLTLIIYIVIAVTILGTTAASFLIFRWLVRKWSLPVWITPLAVLLGFLGGVYIAYFQIFSDLGERYKNESSAPRIDVLIPSGYEGFLYIYFDSSLPPLEIPPNKRITLTMVDNGVILAGEYKDIEKNWMYVSPEIFYLNGSVRKPAMFFPDTSSGQLDMNRIGHRVLEKGFYVGKQEDYYRSIQSADRKSWEIAEKVYRKQQQKEKVEPTPFQGTIKLDPSFEKKVLK